MFERFTKPARAVVTTAAEDAGKQGSTPVDAMNLLVALMRRGDGAAAELIGMQGIGPADVLDRAEHVRRRGGISDADARALERFGIDVDQVVNRVEQEHGAGALVSTQRRTRKHVPFGVDAKRTLERCLNEAGALGDRVIGEEHLLLALAGLPGPAADVLDSFGVEPHVLRTALRRAS